MFNLLEAFINKSIFNPTLEKMSSDDILMLKRNSKVLSYLMEYNNIRLSELIGYMFSNNGNLIGWVIGWKNPSRNTNNNKYDLKIINIYVVPKYRNNNFGRDLILEIIKRQKRVCIEINNNQSNMNNIVNLITELGFKKVENTKNNPNRDFFELIRE